MKRKVKKFGRGGDIVTGIGAALLGKALYDKYSSKDDTKKNLDTIEAPSYDKDKLESKEVKNAQRASQRGPIERSDQRFPDATEQADVRPKSDTGSTTPIKKTEKYDPNAGQDRTPVQGVNEKDLDRLQRRNVPSGGKKSAPAKKSSTDDVIGAGQRFANIGRSSTAQFLKDKGAEPVPNKAGAAPKPETVPARPNTTPKAEPAKEKKYGIGPYGAFSDVHKALSGDKEKEDTKKGTRTYRDFSGKIQTYAKGGSVSSASKRADGIAQRGKTRGKVY